MFCINSVHFQFFSPLFIWFYVSWCRFITEISWSPTVCVRARSFIHSLMRWVLAARPLMCFFDSFHSTLFHIFFAHCSYLLFLLCPHKLCLSYPIKWLPIFSMKLFNDRMRVFFMPRRSEQQREEKKNAEWMTTELFAFNIVFWFNWIYTLVHTESSNIRIAADKIIIFFERSSRAATTRMC